MLFSIDLDPYIQPWGALSGEAGQGPLTRCDFNIDYEVLGGSGDIWKDLGYESVAFAASHELLIVIMIAYMACLINSRKLAGSRRKRSEVNRTRLI
jgi:hypothetical protein